MFRQTGLSGFLLAALLAMFCIGCATTSNPDSCVSISNSQETETERLQRENRRLRSKVRDLDKRVDKLEGKKEPSGWAWWADLGMDVLTGD